jgi:hypothetical protein
VSLTAGLLGALDRTAFFTQATGYVPDNWQARAMQSTADRVLIACGRQVGKTEIAAVMSAHMSQTVAGSLTLLVAPSLRQASEVFRRTTQIYQALPARVPRVAHSALRSEFANGSRVISLPASTATVRGYSPDLLILDEAAWCPTELWHALSPSLSVSGGRVLALSTPNGRTGWFAQAFAEDASWDKVHHSSEDCPRIPKDFLVREQASMPAWMYDTEYRALFVETANRLVFRPELVRQSVVNGIAPFTFSWERHA